MKICFYNPAHITYSSGPEIWLMKILPLFAKSGHKVTLITTMFNYNEDNLYIINQLRASGVNCIELASFSIPVSQSPIPISFKELSFKADILYSNYGYIFQDLIGKILSWKLSAKLVYGCHSPSGFLKGIQGAYYTIITKNLIRFADGAHSLNKDDERNIYSKDTFSIGYGVEKTISVNNIIKKFSGHILNIAYIGRLDDQKNLPRLLAIIEIFKNENQIQFYIGGTGKYKDDVEQLARNNKNLHYVGFVDNHTLNNFYKDKHAFIHLSKYETFCSSIIEALQFGNIIISTDVSGIVRDNRELIKYVVKEDSEIIDSIKELSESMKKNPKRLADYLEDNTIRLKKLSHIKLTNRLMHKLEEINEK